MTGVWFLAAAIFSYLLGSLNFSIIFSNKVMGGDVRNSGSGNAGSTNMLRSYGWKVGVLTLGMDFLRTFLVILCVVLVFDRVAPDWRQTAAAVSGFCVELGHCFPLFFKFKGGKGVAVGAIISLMVDWRCFLIIIVTFLIATAISKYVSLGSMLGALAFPCSFAFFADFSTVQGTLAFIVSILVSGLIIILHRQNISRLIKGEESKLSFHKK